jgi:mannan endo-1,4-beta-mannosidase
MRVVAILFALLACQAVMAARPAYNTGKGFYVADGKLYDANNQEFRIRGVNRAHYDSDSAAGIEKSGANAVRIFLTTQYGRPWSALAGVASNDHTSRGEVAIPTIPAVTDATGKYVGTSCNEKAEDLSTAAQIWVSQAKLWLPLQQKMIFNIANEWGPSNSTVWRDSYIAAIKAMRAAGYTAPLMIDSGGCGQNFADLINYATDVFNADPQKNLIFSLHLYGAASNALASNVFAQLAAMSAAKGMVFVIGEFGPGRNVGASPTTVTPGQIITAAEANNIGWLAWAWDDNDLAGCKADDKWFGMQYGCGEYTKPSDLTIFGADVVLNPTYGLSVIARRASIFGGRPK